MKLTRNMKEWFKELIDNEITQATIAAQNERIWALGSDNICEMTTHELNLIENESYVNFLESIKMKYLGEVEVVDVVDIEPINCIVVD